MKFGVLSTALFLCAVGFAEPSNDALRDVLARMDQAAVSFKGMTAKATIVEHTNVIDENTTESANMTIKKTGPDQAELLLDFTDPPESRRSVIIAGRKLQIYFPKINTVQVYDLGKGGEQIDRFIMLGFGTSGTELAKSFNVTVTGTEALKGSPSIKLALIPTSDEAKKYITKIEMWVPDHGAPYPLQEKIYEPSSDYKLTSYSDVKINPELKPDALKLKLPKGVKTEYPQR